MKEKDDFYEQIGEQGKKEDSVNLPQNDQHVL